MGSLSVAGISALIAASEVAFIALKVTGAAVLLALGVQSLRAARRHSPPDPLAHRAPPAQAAPPASHHLRPRRRRPFRDGLVTSLANPKLAVFFVALFPQFVGRRDTVLSTTLVMAGLIVIFDFVYYTALSLLVSRAKRAFDESRLARALERISGSILIALGIRIAIESR